MGMVAVAFCAARVDISFVAMMACVDQFRGESGKPIQLTPPRSTILREMLCPPIPQVAQAFSPAVEERVIRRRISH